MKYNITYEIISEESAEYGGFQETGFIIEDEQYESGDLNSIIRKYGAMIASSREIDKYTWFDTANSETDYKTGDVTYCSLHLTDVTISSKKRIAKLLERGYI